MEKDSRVWQVRDLFERVWKNGFGEIQPECLTTEFPEYLPPILLTSEAEVDICEASAALCRCADAKDHLVVSANYEDSLQPGDSCVVLTLEVQRDIGKTALPEKTWAKNAASIARALLSSKIGMAMTTLENGMQFKLRLPVHRRGCRSTLHRNAILLVEDDAFVRESSCEVLEAAGYNVLAARDAEEGLQLFERRRKTICAVITDLTLPGMSGKDLARTLHASLAAIPILLTSGYAAPVSEDRSRRLYYLAKPYNPASLLAAVRRCLEVYHHLAVHAPAATGVGKAAIEYCS